MLELGTFPVKDMVFGRQTRWRDGVLEVNKQEALALVTQDSHIRWAEIDIVKPGESARIINAHEIIEPRMKVKGPGMTYPGLSGRDAQAVGAGRTHRLGGMAVVACVDMSQQTADDAGARARASRPDWQRYRFMDMSGAGAVTVCAPLVNLCVSMEPTPGESSESWHNSVQSATLRVMDRLAQTTAGLEPPQLETFDFTPKPGLPGVVLVPHLASPELYRGPYTKMGTAVYGITRASPPWVLSPTEMMDGAIAQVRSLVYTNNPLVQDMFRRHGKDWNFLAVLAYPTNWSMQEEKQAASSRVARIAELLGAKGAIVTTDVRGQRMVETMLTIQALERAGIKTVFLSEEEDPEDGGAPPFITFVPELVATVSTGTGGWDGPFGPVERVIGARNAEKQWFGAQPAVHGRYAISHLTDHYGYGKQSYADF